MTSGQGRCVRSMEMRRIQRLFAVKSGELEVDSRELRAKCHGCMSIWRLLRGSNTLQGVFDFSEENDKIYIFSSSGEKR